MCRKRRAVIGAAVAADGFYVGECDVGLSKFSDEMLKRSDLPVTRTEKTCLIIYTDKTLFWSAARLGSRKSGSFCISV